ncbi:hypothetical protein AgCh_020403 [Apium graveolens]
MKSVGTPSHKECDISNQNERSFSERGNSISTANYEALHGYLCVGNIYERKRYMEEVHPKMEQGRGSISSQGSTPSASMLPPRPGSTFNTEEGATSSRQSSHVWTYFSKEAMPDNPNRFKVHCLICVQNGRPQPPFSYARGTGTGTLSQHLENIHSITKASHESGEARRGPQQSQLGGFMTSTGGGVCKKDWDQADKRQQERKEDSDDDDEPWMTMDTSSESGTSTSEQL